MRYDTELPQEYKSWLKMYRQLKKENLLGDKEVQFAPMTRSFNMPGRSRVYLFDVDFIKARCFDELKSEMFTAQEYDQILFSLIESRSIQIGDVLNEKISNALNDLYEMGEY